MFDDIIKKPKIPGTCKGYLDPLPYDILDQNTKVSIKGVKIWGQKTLKKTNKEVIVCQDKTEQDQTVMDQQQVED